MRTLTALSVTQLVTLYNALGPATPAKPNTFSTKGKAIARIEAFAKEKGADVDALLDSLFGDGTAQTAKPSEAETETQTPNDEDFMARDPRQIITALLQKSIENGATPGEEAASVEKAVELIAKYNLSPSVFAFPARYDAEGKVIPPKKPEPKAEAKPAQPKSGRIIRIACEELLLRTVHVGPDKKPVGMSYEDILASVKAEFPNSKTSIACLRWYAVQLRERGERMPARPRKEKAEKAKAA